MFTDCEIIVLGTAKAQGSKNIGYTKKGSAFMYENAKGFYQWRKMVREAMQKVFRETFVRYPLRVELTVYVPEPKRQFDSKGQFKVNAEIYPRSGRDVDKLTRAVFDAGTKVIWEDDSRIVDLLCRRRFIPEKSKIQEPYVRIKVIRMASLPLDLT